MQLDHHVLTLTLDNLQAHLQKQLHMVFSQDRAVDILLWLPYGRHQTTWVGWNEARGTEAMRWNSINLEETYVSEFQ